ncbi:hypothetical protein KAR91_77020 [Candidatus Pacearchaeota archaeon]|nr:hypothetical protein [Candidatus Pacearchaeota archaeon]
MANKLEVLYPGKTVVDANNPFGTFKNRDDDILKNGTPYERGWASDVWGFLAHILNKAGIVPNSVQENINTSQYYDALDGLIGRRAVKFESEDLIINVQSNTTVDADAKRLSLLDSVFLPKYIDDLNATFNIATDLEAGTTEKASHWYGMWLDSDLNERLVPDLTGVADSFTAGELRDSTATFLTDLVHDGDIVYNLDDKTKTTVSVDAAAEGIVVLVDNIFPLGSENYKIVKMSPEGLGENRERIGTAFNNGSSNFDNSYYTQLQPLRQYSEANSDFAITLTDGTLTTVHRWVLTPYQTIDGTWRMKGNGSILTTSDTTFTVNTSGVIYKDISDVYQALTANASIGLLIDDMGAITVPGTDGILMESSVARTTRNFSFDVELEGKPTFAE